MHSPEGTFAVTAAAAVKDDADDENVAAGCCRILSLWQCAPWKPMLPFRDNSDLRHHLKCERKFANVSVCGWKKVKRQTTRAIKLAKSVKKYKKKIEKSEDYV